jgi:dynein heavy chain
VKAGFKKSIDALRMQNKHNYGKGSGPEPAPKKIQKSYGPSSKEAAYEKLQFPDNMNYEMRSRLRSECMKFLRFTYLVDFLAMHSLKSVYNASVDEFKGFLRRKVDEPEVFMLKENVKEVRSTI